MNAPLSPAKERILLDLKTKGPRTTAQLARKLSVTTMAVRQHLAALEEAGLVSFEEKRGKVGRPTKLWRIADTPEAQDRFPDSHADLTVGLLEAARSAFGEKGLTQLVRERTKQQLAEYRRRIPAGSSLERRVARIASFRRDEGYLAEWSRESDGSFLLIENHCPICAAARACPGLCRGELDLFRKTLGPDVRVEREEYLLEDGRRCTYRIRPV